MEEPGFNLAFREFTITPELRVAECGCGPLAISREGSWSIIVRHPQQPMSYSDPAADYDYDVWEGIEQYVFEGDEQRATTDLTLVVLSDFAYGAVPTGGCGEHRAELLYNKVLVGLEVYEGDYASIDALSACKLYLDGVGTTHKFSLLDPDMQSALVARVHDWLRAACDGAQYLADEAEGD
jgi:hypothetical protein